MVASDRKAAWLVVALLFLFQLINFADKAVIGIAAVPIMQDLQLSPREFGLVGSSFFLLFAFSAVATGFLVNRVQTRWVLAVMALIWALTQFPMIGPVGFGTLVACRVALGAGEGPAAPVALHAIYKWFPDNLRTLPTAIVLQGGAAGVMVALPLLNWVIVHDSWHAAFGVLGILASPGARFGSHLAARDRWAPGARRSTGNRTYRLSAVAVEPDDTGVLGRGVRRQLGLVAGAVVAGSLSDQGAWLHARFGWLLGAAAGCRSVIAMLGTGWYSQFLLSRGVSSRLARGVLGTQRHARRSSPGDHADVSRRLVKIALTTIGVALPAVIFVIGNTVVAEITPPAKRGAVLASARQWAPRPGGWHPTSWAV